MAKMYFELIPLRVVKQIVEGPPPKKELSKTETARGKARSRVRSLRRKRNR